MKLHNRILLLLTMCLFAHTVVKGQTVTQTAPLNTLQLSRMKIDSLDKKNNGSDWGKGKSSPGNRSV